jgi:hypothetical protein
LLTLAVAVFCLICVATRPAAPMSAAAKPAAPTITISKTAIH